MIHEKVSGEANTDPAKVGGEDWDAPHIYGPGEIWPIAYKAFLFDPAGNVVTNRGTAGRIGLTSTRHGAGSYSFDLDVTNMPVAAGATVEYFVHLSPRPYAALPTGWYFDAYIDTEGGAWCYVEFYNAGNAAADLTMKADFNLTVYASIPAA